jgi:Chondroitinase B
VITSAQFDPSRRTLLRATVAGTALVAGAAGGLVWASGRRAEPPRRRGHRLTEPPGAAWASEATEERDAEGYEAIGEGSRRVDVATSEELRRALDDVRPGDRIVLATGIYGDGGFAVRGVRGDASTGLTIEAAEPGGAVLRGAAWILVDDSAHVVIRGIRHEGTASGTEESKYALLIRNSDHVRLTRSWLAMDNSPGDSVNDNDYVLIEGTSERNRIDHCRFGPKSTIGTFIYVRMNAAEDQVCRLTTIDHNHFDRLTGLPNSNYEPVRLGHAAADRSSALTLFEHNLMTDCVADDEFVSVKSSDNVIRFNTFSRMFGALVLRGGDRNDVYSNIWTGERVDNTGGITVNGGVGHRLWNNYLSTLASDEVNRPGGVIFEVVDAEEARVTDCVYVQNTHVDCARNVVVGRERDEYPYAPTDTLIANNLLVADSSYPIIEIGNATDTMLAGNLLSQSGDGGTGRGADLARASLQLEPVGAGLLGPAPGSPLLGAAVSRWAVAADDLLGRPRPRAAAVGALEDGAATGERRELTPTDVGPEAP